MGLINYRDVKFEVGQVVALRYQGNKARREVDGESGYTLSTIEKIGRKYLKLENGLYICLDTGYEKTEFSANYQMFPSVEELLNYLKREYHIKKIRSTFNAIGSVELSNSKIEAIFNIVESDNL